MSENERRDHDHLDRAVDAHGNAIEHPDREHGATLAERIMHDGDDSRHEVGADHGHLDEGHHGDDHHLGNDHHGDGHLTGHPEGHEAAAHHERHDHHDGDATQVIAADDDATQVHQRHDEPTQHLDGHRDNDERTQHLDAHHAGDAPTHHLDQVSDRDQHRDHDRRPAADVYRDGDNETTRVVPAAAVAGAVGAGAAGAAGAAAHRDEHTAVLPADQDAKKQAAKAEQDRIDAARQLEEERRLEDVERRRAAEAERQRRLGTVTPRTDPEPVTVTPQRRITDKFLGSLGLFLLRLVTAAIMGIHGFQKLTSIEATTQFFSQIGLPEPGLMAWGVGIAEILAAVALVFGFLVRFAGLGIAAIAIGALALVHWGAKNPFVAGQSGFTGELELLLAAVGLTLAAIGGGGWGIDAGMRRSRARRKAGL